MRRLPDLHAVEEAVDDDDVIPGYPVEIEQNTPVAASL
jgi:hypothetical protein